MCNKAMTIVPPTFQPKLQRSSHPFVKVGVNKWIAHVVYQPDLKVNTDLAPGSQTREQVVVYNSAKISLMNFLPPLLLSLNPSFHTFQPYTVASRNFQKCANFHFFQDAGTKM